MRGSPLWGSRDFWPRAALNSATLGTVCPNVATETNRGDNKNRRFAGKKSGARRIRTADLLGAIGVHRLLTDSENWPFAGYSYGEAACRSRTYARICADLLPFLALARVSAKDDGRRFEKPRSSAAGAGETGRAPKPRTKRGCMNAASASRGRSSRGPRDRGSPAPDDCGRLSVSHAEDDLQDVLNET
jgi:hypothetical protein